MTESDFDRLQMPQRNVRLDTLVRLRWLTVIGQTTTVLAVHFGLKFTLPIWSCLAVIALSAWLNVALRVRFTQIQRLEPDRTAWLLAFDVAELAVLLFLTGGLENPFAFLFLAPVLISATALPPRLTLLLGAFAMICATILVFAHYPLPWSAENPLNLPDLYMVGMWLSILIAIGFIGIYAWQITEESRKLANALAATELVLAREQHLSQLDGLAAAAAHALGTPLSTISVIARELERSIESKSPYADDVRLLREQSQRCREILSKLSELSAANEPFDRLPLASLIEEVVAPHRNFGIDIAVNLPPQPGQPVGARNPAHHLRARQYPGERRRLRSRAGRSDRGMERTGYHCHRQRRWSGFRAGSHQPHRRALYARRAPSPNVRRRIDGSRSWIIHRQNAARTLGSRSNLREPSLAAARRRHHRALDAYGLRTRSRRA